MHPGNIQLLQDHQFPHHLAIHQVPQKIKDNVHINKTRT